MMMVLSLIYPDPISFDIRNIYSLPLTKYIGLDTVLSTLLQNQYLMISQTNTCVY